MSFVNKEAIKMAKYARKKTKKIRLRKETKVVKKAQKTTKFKTKAEEYTDCLLELHKLQGTLLTRLRKEI
jgi:hypothetical protein